jgi:hypothetical protein
MNHMSAFIKLSVVVPGVSANPARPGTQITVNLYVYQGLVQTPIGRLPVYIKLPSSAPPFPFGNGDFEETITLSNPNLQYGIDFTVDNASVPPSAFIGNWNDTTDCSITNGLFPYGPITVFANETVDVSLQGQLGEHHRPPTLEHPPTISFDPKKC